MIFGVLYWFVWRVVFPKVFGYELVPRKEELGDGTVVTVVSQLPFFGIEMGFLTRLWFRLVVLDEENLMIMNLRGH